MSDAATVARPGLPEMTEVAAFTADAAAESAPASPNINTAMQSVMPSVGTALGVADVWISIAYTWSALLWVICAPIWARRSDRRGRKAMMAIGLLGFIGSFALCGMVLLFLVTLPLLLIPPLWAIVPVAVMG